MGEFGWAYISGSNQNVGGPVNSVQVRENSTQLTGSQNLTFDPSTQTLALTGTMNVSGTVNANAFNIDVINKNITNLDIYGSSKFGDTTDDQHQFTGSVEILGNLSASINISASSFYGDGSQLENIIASTVPDPLVVGIVTGSTAISGAVGRFGTIEGSLNASNLVGTLNLPIVSGSTAISGALGRFGSIAGSLTTADQSAITAVGDLSSLNIVGDLTVDTSTLKVFSSGDNVAIGRSDTADKKLEIYSNTGGQFRLSNLNGSFPANIVYTDFNVDTDGDLTITPSGNDIYLSGNVYITGSTIRLTDIPSGTATTSSYLALDANRNIILTSSSGGGGGSGGTIGDAEDAGGYEDGLFTDFDTTTPVGTPIDRFNEVLKILAPSPAPAVSAINEDVTDGETAKLSFGASNPVHHYTSSATAAGFSAVGRTGIYSASTSGSNIRLGIYDKTQDITGFINHNVVESITNGYSAYSNDAFGNANEGTLKLELNGTVVHSVSLSGLVGSGNPNTGSTTSLTGDSGFTNVSVTASSFDGNGSDWYIFKHRTAKYKIAAADQKTGWNYLRVIHSLTSDNTTNYVEWINDPSGAVNDLSISGQRVENVSLAGSKFLSGVEYNTDATANYKAVINNLYRNVYSSTGNPISFTVSNSSTPSSQAVPDISGDEDNTRILGITASLDFNGSTLFSGSITCNTTVTHPLKNTISNQGSATTGDGFLIDNRTLASTNLEEKFHDETYRKTSGSYSTQASVTNASARWDSENHMTGGGATGHTDGLLFHNQRLYSPIDSDIPNGGNFSGLINVAAGQPNYSSIVGTRTFYRVVSNSSGVAKRDMKIVSTKNSTTYNNSTLGAGNVHFFVKIPESTGWMDISQNFSYGNTEDGNGALISGASNDVDSGNNTHFITFGTKSVANNEHVMVKILADETWGGYLTELSFSVGATTNTATESDALDNIDLDDAAGVTAKLSFGTNNSVAEYSNATGSSIGLSNYNINDLYNDEGTTRRGVFETAVVMNGTLNEDVSANGSNYTANSFRNAYTGSLLLIVNGLTASTLSLANLNTNNNLSSNTGFSVGTVGFSTTSDDIPDYTKPYRQGTYSIGTGQQNVGWNYARVIHRIGATDTLTNYVEWIVDPSGSTDDTAVSTPILSDFGHTSIYYQSGIGYYASNPTASFAFSGSNFYRNVYQNGTAISFPTTTNCAVTSIEMTGSGITGVTISSTTANMPLLNSSSNCHLTEIQVTGTLQYDGSTPSISGGLGLYSVQAATATGRILHPLKSDRTTNSATKSNLFVFSGSLGSTNLNTAEYFGLETYRVVSGNYANQAAVTSSANAWNSQTALNGGNNHDDGMVTAAGYAISPLQIGVAGNTGHASLQAPAGNPDYSTSGLTNDVRTYYRYFKYTSASTVASFTLTLRGDANLVGKTGTYAASLGANKNCFVEFKVAYDPNYPGADDQSTGWADCAKIFDASDQPNNDGAGIRSGDMSGEDQTIDSGGLALSLTLGTRRIKQNQYVLVKVSAHKDWTGYLSRIEVTY